MLKRKYSVLNIGIVSALMMFIIMLPSMFSHHGIFIIRGDYVDQYIPRLIKAKEILTTGGATWDWYNFLGATYNKFDVLFSLNSLCLLFPSDVIPYAVTYMHPIRIALVGMISFLYLRRMVKNEKYAFLGALLYTFSSYTFLNMEFMQFIEGMWTFPLLLLAAEKMFTEEKNNHLLIPAVFINCMLSSYLFILSTICFSLYFLSRFFLSEEWRGKRRAKFFFLAVCEYILGVMCAAIAFVPFIYRLFNSSGSAASSNSSLMNYLIVPAGIVARVFSFFVPAGSNRFSIFGSAQCASYAMYIPIFGVSFALALLLSKHRNKKWIISLCVLGIVSIVWAGMSLILNFFTALYTRYAFCMLMFFIIATVMFLDNYDARTAKISVWATLAMFIALVLGFYGLSLFADNPDKILYSVLFGSMEEKVEADSIRIFVLTSSVLMYICLVVYVYSDKFKKLIIPAAVVVIILYGCGYSFVNMQGENIFWYYKEFPVSVDEQVEKYYIDKPETDSLNNHRIDFSRQFINYSYTMKKPSISIFESVRNPYTDEMAEYLNIRTERVSVLPVDRSNSTRTLLGVKYYYDYYPEDKYTAPEGFSYLKTDKGVDIYQNDCFMGMGFSYNSFITRSEFKKLSDGRENCSDIMLDALVVEDEDRAFVETLLKPYNSDTVNKERVLFKDFEYNSSGFTGVFESDKEEIVFVSVPCEKGWKAKINGSKADFIKANIGCMAFKVKPGVNNISFEFKNPAIELGKIISVIGILLSAIYILISKKITKKAKL